MPVIYKILSPSNKVYIGQTWDYKKRMSGYKNISCKRQPKLYNSLLKYSVDNHSFTIVHELPEDISQGVLDTYEQLYIDQYRDCGIQLMNIREAGSHGKHSQESIEKLRKVNLGRKYSDEFKKRRSEIMKGNTLRLGSSQSEETKLKMGNSRRGQVRSEETRLKMRNSAIGKKKSLEHIRKVVEAKRRNRELKLEINLENS
jgi:group I intron endonuclease